MTILINLSLTHRLELYLLTSLEYILVQVMFPSTLLGTGEDWTLMKTISVTEYLNYEAGNRDSVNDLVSTCFLPIIHL